MADEGGGNGLRRDLLGQLSFFRELGVTHLRIPVVRSVVKPAADLPESTEPQPRRTSVESAARELTLVREDLGDCQRCRLATTRTNLVFGVGDPAAELMFVGEAPGEEEDRQGEPFVGRAGQLLTRIIAAMNLRREQVYIANVLKCRPPDNRDPDPSEVDCCEPFLHRQIAAVRPLVLVALGRWAAQTLLKTTTPISQLRGRFFEYRGTLLLPTFHPSYLLRNPSQKKVVWEDMKSVMERLRQLGSRHYPDS